MSANTPLSNISNNKTYKAIHKSQPQAIQKNKKKNLFPIHQSHKFTQEPQFSETTQQNYKQNYIQNKVTQNPSQQCNVAKMKSFLTSFTDKSHQNCYQEVPKQQSFKLDIDEKLLQKQTKKEQRTTRDSLIQTETEYTQFIIEEHKKTIQHLESESELKESKLASKNKVIRELQEENEKLHTTINYLEQEVHTRVSGCIRCDQRFQIINKIRTLLMKNNKDMIDKLSQLEQNQNNQIIKAIEYPDQHYMLCKELESQFVNYSSDVNTLYTQIAQLDTQNTKFGELTQQITSSGFEAQSNLIKNLREEVSALKNSNEDLKKQLEKSKELQVQLWHENTKLKDQLSKKEKQTDQSKQINRIDQSTQMHTFEESKHERKVAQRIDELNYFSDQLLAKTKTIQ